MRPSTEIETLNRAFFPREWQIALMTPRIAQQSLAQLLAPSASAAASSCRTAHGAEADLVLRFHDGETWVVEIKRASALTTSKGFHQAATDVGATKRLLLAPVATSYPTRVGVAVMPPCRGQAAGRPRKAIAVPHCWRER